MCNLLFRALLFSAAEGCLEVIEMHTGGSIRLLEFPERVFSCATPQQVRESLPEGVDVLAFQCRNPIHKAHYELFIRALDAPNVSKDAVCLVHPTCGPTQVQLDSSAMITTSLALLAYQFHQSKETDLLNGLCCIMCRMMTSLAL